MTLAAKKILALNWRRLMKIMGITGIFLLIALGTGMLYIDSTPGQKWLISRINDRLKGPDSQVIITSVKGSVFSDFTIDKMSVSDQKGPWLELEKIHLKWSLWGLMKKRISLSEMAVERLVLIRTPENSKNNDSPEAKTFTLPRLPLDIEIASFTITNFLIEKNIVSRPAAFTSYGQLKLTRAKGILAKIKLINQGKSKDDITVDITYPGEGRDLSIDMQVMAPKGGIFAELIGTDPKYDVLATLTGSGPLENWAGRIQIHVGEDTIADATLRHVGRAFSVRGKLAAGDYIPDTGAALLGRTASLSLDLNPNESYDRTDLSFELMAETLTLKANGSLVHEHIETADSVNFSLEVTDSRPFNRMFAPLNFAPFKIEGSLSDLTQNAKLSVTTDNFNFAYGSDIKATFRGELEAQSVSPSYSFKAKGRLENISGSRVSDYSLFTAPGFSWILQGKVDVGDLAFTIDHLSIGNDRLTTMGQGQYSSNLGRLEAHIEASLPDLSTLVPTASGAVNILADVSQAATGQPLQAQFQTATTGLDVGDDLVNDFLGKAPSLKANITQAGDRTLTVEDALLKGQHLKLTFNGAISPEQMIERGDFQLALSDLAQVQATKDLKLDGDIDILGRLSGPLVSPSLTLETAINRFDLQGLILKNVAAHAKAENILTSPKGEISLSSTSNYGNLAGKALFAASQDNIYRISGIDLSLGAYRTTGNIAVTAGKPAIGQLTITTENTAIVNQALRGTLGADIQLTNKNNLQQVTAQGHVNDMMMNLGENDILTIKTGSFSADALLGDKSPKVTFKADVAELMHPRLQAQEGHITLQQNDQSIDYSLNIMGTEFMPYELTFTGNIMPPQPDKRQISLNLIGTIDHKAIELKDPLVISLMDEGFSLSPFTLQLGEGYMGGDIKILKNDILVKLNAKQADLRPLLVFIPDIPLVGLLSGDFTIAATPDFTDGSFAFKLSHLYLGNNDIRLDEKLEITTKGKITKDNVSFVSNARLDDLLEIEASASLPLLIDVASANISLPVDKPIQGQMTWQGDITPIWPIFDLVNHDLSGKLDAKYLIGGTLSNPDLDGYLRLSEGRYEILRTGFVIADIDMAATITDRHLVLDHLTANDGAKGRITAKGDVTLHADFSYDAQAELTASHTQIIRQPQLDVTASSELQFLKTPALSYLKGDITVENANIGAITSSGPSIPELDVKEINLPNQDSRIIQDTGSHIGPFPLDLIFNVPGKLFIRSYGMDSEWKADLIITGNSSKPIVAGSASLIRGIFEFSGKRFTLTKGTLTFPNDKSNDPTLDISAELNLTDLTAILNISGRASKPILTVRSSPELPEDEILSRILFGTSITELSPIEALQLAAAIRSLSTGGGPGFMGDIRNSLGLDRLSVDKADGHDYGTTITGGKYLTNNVYIEVTTAPATGETATSVEVSLSKKLSLVTRQTMDQGRNLALRWSWKY